MKYLELPSFSKPSDETHKWSLKAEKGCIELPQYSKKLEREKHFWTEKIYAEKHDFYEAPEPSLFDTVSDVSGSPAQTPKAVNPYFHNEFQQFVEQDNIDKSKLNTQLNNEIRKSMAQLYKKEK